MRILSFGHYLQGPAATQYLTDMGADAVKVEPLGGAFERKPLAPELLPEGRSALFLAANRTVVEVALADGPLRLVSHPLRYDGEVPEPRRPPPDLGAGGRAVLAEGGFERQEIEDLIDRGVVAACGDGTRCDSAPAVTPRQTRA